MYYIKFSNGEYLKSGRVGLRTINKDEAMVYPFKSQIENILTYIQNNEIKEFKDSFVVDENDKKIVDIIIFQNELKVKVVKETPKAYCLSEKYNYWFPKNHVQIFEDRVYISNWIKEQKQQEIYILEQLNETEVEEMENLEDYLNIIQKRIEKRKERENIWNEII